MSPYARVATTQPMRCATPEAHDDVDRRLDRSRESAAVPSSAVQQGEGTGLHGRIQPLPGGQAPESEPPYPAHGAARGSQAAEVNHRSPFAVWWLHLR